MRGIGLGWRRWLQDAFSLEPDYEPFDKRELELLDRVARFVVRRRMAVPAIFVLESVKPMSYVGSQALAFFEPLVQTLFTATEYSEYRRILERRPSVEVLLTRIEQHEAETQAETERPKR